jgi:hypothetical protein
VIGFFVLFALLITAGAATAKLLARAFSPVSSHRSESHIHRCDFCKEAILQIDEEARCFVQHAGRKPLLGYSVVNACGACVRERMVDGVLSFESADPSV